MSLFAAKNYSEVTKINSGLEETKRWYDNDATVSLAVSILRNSDLEKQVLASKKIIEHARSKNVEAKDVSFYVRTFRRRWYDVDESLALAMEFFKESPQDVQKTLAVIVINFLCEMEL